MESPSSVFRTLSQQDKELLDQHHKVSNYRKGEAILKEGTRPKGLMCLVSGKAKVFSVGAGNREQIIKMLKPQNFIGYRALFSENGYPFSVSAIEESSVITLDKHVMSKILKQNSELAIKFLRIVSEELIFSNNRLISLTQKHVRGRLSESLLILRAAYGLEADGCTLRVMISREDLAHLSNMTTSNAIRTLSGMVSEKIIEHDGKRIKILDFDKLQEISESGQ